jgi:hypothetical protein
MSTPPLTPFERIADPMLLEESFMIQRWLDTEDDTSIT